MLGVNLIWTPNQEPDVAGYHIYYGPQSRAYTNRITVSGRTMTAARLEPLEPRARYFLAMTAFNTAGVESLPSRELVYDAPAGVNTSPTITAIGGQTLAEDTPSAPLPFTIADRETPASELVVSAWSSNPWLIPDEYIRIDGSGAQRTLTLIPQLEQWGFVDILLEVRDPQGASEWTWFNVFVVPINDAPVISSIPEQVINEDGASGRLPYYVFDAESPPEALWVFAVSSEPLLIPDENIVLTGSGNSRSLSFTPANDAFGACIIQVYVADDEAYLAMTEFLVTVQPANDPPLLLGVRDLATAEDTVSPVLNLTATDIDNPPGDLVVTASSSDPLLVSAPDINVAAVLDKRAITITPKPNQYGSCVVRLVLTDRAGASSSNSFTFTVRPVNDKPTLDPIPNLTLEEAAAPVAVRLTGIGSGASNELQPLFVTASSTLPELIPPPVVDYVSPNDFATLLISPVATTNGTATITVSVSDGQPANGVTTRSFTVSLRPFNNPPVIYSLPDFAVLRVPTPLQINFTVQDPDTPAEQLALSAYSSDPSVLPASNLVFTGTGTQRTLTVHPFPGRTGLVIVTIVVSDGAAAVSTSFYVLISAPGV